MSRRIDWAPTFAGMTWLLAAIMLLLSISAAAGSYPGVGRTAKPDEIRAWDIDVRPDFKGLPPGSGSVAEGQKVWDAKCASCHGTFGESNEVFTPLVGGTTKKDIESGRVAALTKPDVGRTTLMKVSTLSTLWDYIHRAMPWNAPKSLSTDEVYAVVAYLLNLGDILPDDFTLSDRNIAEVQKLLPNRNGMTRDHGLWDVKGRADVKNVACMKNCASEVQVTSSLPEYAQASHGDPSAQNRSLGTGKVAAEKVALVTPNPADLAKRKGCLACHGLDKRVVGPGLREVAARYRGQEGAEEKLAAKVNAGGSGNWGSMPMPPNPDLAPSDARLLIQWILAGAK